ncbi:MAG: hypothetical protein ACRCW1_11560, partial [Anaerotignaceae bacterium]
MRNKLKFDMKTLKNQIKQHKTTFALFVVLRALVILVLIAQLLKGNYENVFMCGLTLILFMVPS